MSIATLLIASVLLKAIGTTGVAGMTAAIAIGSVICIIAAMAGDTSQDLKTGFLIGSTPVKQQIGELIGALVSAVAIGAILYLFNEAWGFGSAAISAPQASLMKLVVEGVFGGNLPWNLVFAGAGLAVVIEILGIPVLPFAVGLYLPIHLSTPMLAGGLIRYYFENRKEKTLSVEERKHRVDKGILYSSGLIAGEGLVGILLAVLAILKVKGKSLGDIMNLSETVNLGNVGGLVFFALLCATLCLAIAGREKKKD